MCQVNFYVPIGHPLPPEKVGNKFANLGRAAECFCVPRALCVTIDAFRAALGPDRRQFLEQFFADLQATVGCFLLSAMPALQQAMDSLMLTEPLCADLKAHLEETFGSLENHAFAVRSSGATEDSISFSFAGVYKTKLGVKGFEEICDAIVECWKAYYDYPAVAARVRANQYDPSPAMALIIQEMVPAELAGVAFATPSAPDGVIVEYVQGTGENLVSGTATPKRYRAGDGSELPAGEQQAMTEICMAVTGLKELFGYDVDVEWAWDKQGLHILQVRPVTEQLGRRKVSREPFFCTAALYLDANLPPEMSLGECSDVYITYTVKRANAYRLASKLKISSGDAHVLEFNGPGLLEHREELERLLHSSQASRVVLDISSNIRQVILKKNEVLNYLQDTFSLTPASADRHTIIMRDFIKGQYGFISRLIGERGLLIEYSPDGLLNINRGIAHCQRIVVLNGDRPARGENVVHQNETEALEAFRGAIPDIQTFTRALSQELPGVQLEWVLEAGIPYFVDFSREQGDIAYNEQVGTVMIAPGVARGPVFRLDDDQMLSRLSIGPAVSVDKHKDVREHQGLQSLANDVAACAPKPIILVRRPYVILSVLFEHVAGFVFTEGSLLCHLSILLREAHLPAVICKNVEAQNGDEVMIADGRLTIPQ